MAPVRALVSPFSVRSRVSAEKVTTTGGTSLVGAERIFADVALTTSGLWRNHGFELVLSGQAAQVSDNRYRFSRPNLESLGYVYSRGYAYVPTDLFGKVSGNYRFPLFYPDFALGAWIYLRRISANLYFDYTAIQDEARDISLSSGGSELTFETNAFRVFPLDIGIRHIRRFDSNDDIVEAYLRSVFVEF